MRGSYRAAMLAALLGASTLLAQPPLAPAPKHKPLPAAAKLQHKPDSAEAAAPVLTGPKSAAYLIELKAKNVPAGSAILWDVSYKVATSNGTVAYVEAADVQSRIIKAEQAFLFAGPKGEYRVKCRLVKGEDSHTLTWNGEITQGVAPTPPVPPGPNPPVPPGPNPPVPPVPPTPAPVPLDVEGLHVLILSETEDASKLPAGARQAIFAQDTMDYLRAHCATDPLDPKTKQFRVWDKNVDGSKDSPVWDTAMKRSLDKISKWAPAKDAAGNVTGPTSPWPWVLISKKGVGSYEGPLPVDSSKTARQNVDAFLELLKKYGG